MESLNEEQERQAEERIQAAYDEDYYDHLQWRSEDAAVLLERGQAPLVYNQARQTMDWIAGTQKRMRKDYKILGREKGDVAGAEVVTQVVKSTDDANLTPWHQSKAFKQAAIGGLGWLEEGISTEPGSEIIWSGSEDWRNVYRDSRSRKFDLEDARYMFRRRSVDLDYAIALLPGSAEKLRRSATDEDRIDEDSPWYLGERLTGASDIGNDGLPSDWRGRRAYIAADQYDRGRRTAVDLIEAWYRVPETVKVFSGGPQDGQVVNDTMNGHAQLLQDGWSTYQAVKMRMRVMICTEDEPLWDGKSPFAHGRFLLIPIWGYRRYRDGMAYGVMRGMRDLQDDMNKRASKALWLLSSNRMSAEVGAFDDVEEAREEAARADGVIQYKKGYQFRLEPATQEAQANLLMMDRNAQFMRDVGGVTNANLGRGAAGQSGVSVERQQDQGSLTTFELFDNLLLARKLAGQLRLSHIKQFKTKASIIRVVGEGQPVEWVPINTPDERGEIQNDMTAINADYIVAEQDYRESYVRAATQEMFQLLGQIATFAPQVVMAVLDLAVEGSEVKNPDEWVARIRKLNGQRDPTKEPTPEEQAQAEQEAQRGAEAQELQRQMAIAGLKELEAKVDKLSTESMAKKVDALYAALQAAQVAAQTPGIAPVADVLVKDSGFRPAPTGVDPDIPQPAPVQPMQPALQLDQAIAPAPDDAQPLQGEGAHAGIETPTGADNGPAL